MNHISSELSLFENDQGIKMAKKGSIYLHNLIDPIKEGQDWAATQLQNIKNHHILVFGLGLGYHISALDKLIEQEHLFSQFKISVVEPDLLFKNLFEQKK